MGMYTQFVYHVNLKEDAPKEIEELFSRWNYPEDLPTPDHEFFACERWRMIVGGGSWVDNGRLRIKTELKNYGGEIDKFLDWITPYVKEEPGIQGFHFYEEAEEPTYLVVTGE